MPRRRKPLDPDKLVTVTLVCLSCREERVIHVPRERDATERACWECFECQGSGARSPGFGRTRPGKDNEIGTARSKRAESEEKE